MRDPASEPPKNIDHAAHLILQCWQSGTTIDALDSVCHPGSPEEGYAIQSALADLRNEPVVGWKIAATSAAGRAHIHVDQPLAGRLYQSIVLSDGALVPLESSRMGVAEAEIVLMLGRDLPSRGTPYLENDVAEAIESVHPGLEIPDSRFTDFTKVGAACLIADNACARHFVLGPAASTPIDLSQLAGQHTALLVNDQQVTSGQGQDALGGPLSALCWIANKLNDLGLGLRAGQFVTTGVTGSPSPIRRGDKVVADLGSLGIVSATVT